MPTRVTAIALPLPPPPPSPQMGAVAGPPPIPAVPPPPTTPLPPTPPSRGHESGADGVDAHADRRPTPAALTHSMIAGWATTASPTLGEVVSEGWDSARHSPCFYKALAWGAGVALALSAHTLRRVRAPGGPGIRTAAGSLRVASAGWLGFWVTFYGQWWLCKEEEYATRAELAARSAAQASGSRGGADRGRGRGPAPPTPQPPLPEHEGGGEGADALHRPHGGGGGGGNRSVPLDKLV
jgi:hypothetical protein